MKIRHPKLTLLLLAAISLPAAAITNQQVYTAPLKVEPLQITNSANNTLEYNYTVDGVKIELSEKDRHLARNWGLTEPDWAKYKYIMEYTPRGLWSPDLDPPIALGNMASSDQERLYYARVMTNLEMARRNREAAMTIAGEMAAKEYANGGTIPAPKKPTGLAAVLTDNRTKLRSIFVDLKRCDKDCRMFLTLSVSSSSSQTKIDMHFTGGGESEATQLLNEIGIDDFKIKQKAISISASLFNPIVEKYRAGGSVPYYINKTDEKTYTKHM